MKSEMQKNLYCRRCGSGALAADKFCRRCGARHTGAQERCETPVSLALTLSLDEAPTYATAPLATETASLATEMMHRPISGPLVKSVTGSLSAPAQLQSRWSNGLLLALTSLSIWLMIVLLSPLDAYAAARVTVAR